jgi:hypothetical protein
MSIETGCPSIAASASMPPADAPAQDAEAVDHRRVRIGADHRVGICDAGVVDEDDAGQELEIDLMDNAGIRRHDFEVAERRLSPAQKRVALGIPRVFDLGVSQECERTAEFIDLHRVIDHQFYGLKRVDSIGIAAEPSDGVAHRRQVDDARHAGEILQQYATRGEGDFATGLGGRLPLGERFDVFGPDRETVLRPQ